MAQSSTVTTKNALPYSLVNRLQLHCLMHSTASNCSTRSAAGGCPHADALYMEIGKACASLRIRRAGRCNGHFGVKWKSLDCIGIVELQVPSCPYGVLGFDGLVVGIGSSADDVVHPGEGEVLGAPAPGSHAFNDVPAIHNGDPQPGLDRRLDTHDARAL